MICCFKRTNVPTFPTPLAALSAARSFLLNVRRISVHVLAHIEPVKHFCLLKAKYQPNKTNSLCCSCWVICTRPTRVQIVGAGDASDEPAHSVASRDRLRQGNPDKEGLTADQTRGCGLECVSLLTHTPARLAERLIDADPCHLL